MAETADFSAAARMRIDKWLWAARFYKTRSLAAQAIAAGHVRLEGLAVKAARELQVGASLEIAVGDALWTVVVRGLNAQRRPAVEAQQLYEETADSRARRLAQQEAKRLAPVPGSELRGRPTKKARRLIRGFNDNF
ncbi:MAG: Heat shock protein 15 [Candidatus Accumulibacter appositus]|uniref:Heat shock protein 15 n=1 Tax=Candidatus Accumulibacter appositus TaxID=1454003 RepID=A0A011NDI5_9PROT|nr:RNA-binding S4 domain-containing protein [Accumulibacter sp.]EXI80758.1 MAG: Heat shock protein 15 [Candidatus Accumulibacter appositus]HRF06224.1 RNA-binding S4 domain-containing protein [Accumulibacter sp.]